MDSFLLFGFSPEPPWARLIIAVGSKVAWSCSDWFYWISSLSVIPPFQREKANLKTGEHFPKHLEAREVWGPSSLWEHSPSALRGSFKSLPSTSSCPFGSYSPGRGSSQCSGAFQEDQQFSWEVDEWSLNFISQKAEVCAIAVMISETKITWFSWFGNFRLGIKWRASRFGIR